MPASFGARVASAAAQDRRLKLPEVLAGFYAATMLDWLVRTGALAELVSGTSIAEVAASRSIDLYGLRQILRFLMHVTAVVSLAEPDRCELGDGLSLDDVSHALDLYVGAFGPCLDNLAGIQQGRSGGELVDWKRHANAFSVPTLDPVLPRLLASLDIRCLLEVGCGSGQLLQSLAEANEKFCGIGIDSNAAVIQSARTIFASLGFNDDRLQLFTCNIFDIRKNVPFEILDAVDAVCVRGVVNSFFSGKESHYILKFIDHLKTVFQGRLVILADYYGKLSLEPREVQGYTRTLLHDVAQVLSAQGTPPSSLADWRSIYFEAGATLFKELHYSDGGVDHFIHLLQL
jgi:SAM-dependent methyltransferase